MRIMTLGVLAGLSLAAAVKAPASAQQQDYGMRIINATGAVIEVFNFSECRSNNWRGDRLGPNEVIQPGGSRHFDMHDGIRDCCRDMRARFAGGQVRERMGVNVCRESEWVVRP